MKTIHFCAGLPRSGSTILMNILQQNPSIFTTATDALYNIIGRNILIDGRKSEQFQAMNHEQADDAFYGMIHGAMRGWYSALTNKPIVISKNRAWPQIHSLFPDSKFIVIIRDLRDVVESFDRFNRKIKALNTIDAKQRHYSSMTENQKYDSYFDNMNAFSDSLYNQVPRMMELFKQDSSRVKFIRYEDLIVDPNQMLNRIYNFLDINHFKHDLNNIEQSYMFEHDNAYFMERTEHKTHKKFLINHNPKRMLSQSFHDKIVNENRWFYDAFYPITS
jgi:sulfotransferase